MSGLKSQEEQAVHAEVEQVRKRLQDLAAELRVVDDEFEKLAPRRAHHELLDEACGSLERLAELGAAALFWGERAEPARVAEQLSGARSRVRAFQAQVGEMDERRRAILARIGCEEENLEILGEDLYQIRVEEERRKSEWAVERDISPVPHRAQLMAWTRGTEDDSRFRRTLGASLMVSLFLGILLPMIPLPIPKRFEPEDVSRRFAQLVRHVQAKPSPPPAVVAEKPDEKTQPELEKPKPTEEPKASQRPDRSPSEPAARAEAEPSPSEPWDLAALEPPAQAAAGPEPRRVEKAGILAFRDEFASLVRDSIAPRLGADARYGDAEDASRGQAPSRSMLTTNAPGSSGGINLASLSRNVGGGGGGGSGSGGGGTGGGGAIQGVELGRATSSIASIGGGERPLARGGPGLSRTDEEIQIVFDRYKAAFYRLYNRELRNDPTLQGQMVLRLTIEPDGSVSMCKLESSDMDAPDLAAQVVRIVRTIDFGAKDGVQALTIVYPIDFLPAA